MSKQKLVATKPPANGVYGRMQLQWSGYRAAASIAAAEISGRNQNPKVEEDEQYCPHAGLEGVSVSNEVFFFFSNVVATGGADPHETAGFCTPEGAHIIPNLVLLFSILGMGAIGASPLPGPPPMGGPSLPLPIGMPGR